MHILFFLLFSVFVVPNTFAADKHRFETSRECIGCDLTDFVAVNSNFNDSVLRDSDLSRCNLDGSTFDNSFFANVVLDHCSLQLTSFKNVDLTSTSLSHADVAGSDFAGAKVSVSNFLSSYNWQYAKNFHHLSLSRADLFQGALELYKSGGYKQSLVLIDQLLLEDTLPSYLHLRSLVNLQMGQEDNALEDIIKSSELYLANGDIHKSEAMRKYADEFSELHLNSHENSFEMASYISSLLAAAYWLLLF